MSSKKISANIPDDVYSALEQLAAQRQTTMTEVLKQAVKLEAFLATEKQKGTEIYLEDKDKKVRQLVFAR